MHERELYRFNSPIMARDVVNIATKLSAADFKIDRRPVSKSESERGVGDYVIMVRTDTPLEYGSTSRLEHIIDEAILFVVCDELKYKDGPFNQVLHGMWKLNPENREQVYANSRRLEAELILSGNKKR